MSEKRMPEISLPAPVREILDTLEQNGHEAYIVGGCVRDAIIGIKPKDWDITTSALPEQVKSLFSNTADTGIQHGTVMVILRGTGYEVTTYRIDGEYRDGRHPESVIFTRSLEEDLKRRDFTINALAYDPKKGVVDLHGGIEDLNAGRVRCVGDPDERFTEDALRILRAVRFSAQLSFSIDPETYAAIARHAQNLEHVSRERIREEFEKTLLSPNPGRIYLYRELCAAPYLFPEKELSEKGFEPLREEVFTGFSGTPEEKRILRISAFLHALTEEEAGKTLRFLKYDNHTIRLVTGILRNKNRKIRGEKAEIKSAMHRMGKEVFLLLLSYQAAVNGEDTEEVRRLTEEILEKEEPYETAHLAVRGDDLLMSGMPEGAQIGAALNELLERVIKEPELNRKEVLLELAQQFRNC